MSPSITVSRSRSTSNPASPVNPSADCFAASPDKGYLDALGKLGDQLRRAKLEEEEKSGQLSITKLPPTSVAEAVRAAMKARRGAAPVIPRLSAFELSQHFSNADAMKGKRQT